MRHMRFFKAGLFATAACLAACMAATDPGLDKRYSVEFSSPSSVAGKRFHWSSMPVKIRYNGCSGCGSSIENAVKRGIEFWQKNATLYGEIKTTYGEPADIEVKYTGSLGGSVIGVCSASLAQSSTGQIFIVTPLTLTISLTAAGITLTEADFESTAAHEMGHCLGLWEHSPSDGDLMYAYLATTPVYSARDLNSLRWLYTQKSDLGAVNASALGQSLSLTGEEALSPPLILR